MMENNLREINNGSKTKDWLRLNSSFQFLEDCGESQQLHICQKDRMVCEHSPCPYIYMLSKHIRFQTMEMRADIRFD